MKKTVLTLALLIISLIGYSQEKVNVPGTRVWLNPPKGSALSKNFMGFYRKDGVSIEVVESTDGSLEDGVSMFLNVENYENQGFKVIVNKKTEVNGYSGVYIHAKNQIDAGNQMLVFGDSTFFVLLLASYSIQDKKLTGECKKTLFSTIYKKSQKIKPFAHAFFRLDDTHTSLKFHKYSMNMYRYMIKAKDTTKNDILLVVNTRLREKGTSLAKNTENLTLEAADKFVLTKVISDQAKKIDNQEAHEIIAVGGSENNSCVFYTLLVEKEGKVVIFQSIQPEEEYNQEVLTELINTLRFKK